MLTPSQLKTDDMCIFQILKTQKEYAGQSTDTMVTRDHKLHSSSRSSITFESLVLATPISVRTGFFA